MNNKNYTRRQLLKGVVAASVVSAIAPMSSVASSLFSSSVTRDGWSTAYKIVSEIIEPKFANNEYTITDYFSDKDEDYELAFNKAIKACHQAGGGKVIVPAGEFLTGPIHLLSNVNLHLEKGAVIKFVTDPNRYLPAVKTRWEGME
ncbi:MAG: hypothetical protein KTR16_15145, partial [Acidiferrobacterales bacterium]|nr:hypothetical protein [Acidiferrobacterales bacterium]